MKNAKLIEVIKSFSVAEMRDLAIFIERTKAKENTFAYQLFILLNKNYPDFLYKNIAKEKVYKKLFGDKKYDDNKLSKIMSELTKLVEEFIITLQSKINILQNKLELLKFYNERNLEKYYLQCEKEINKLQLEMPIGVLSQMLNYQFEEVKLNYSLKHQDRNTNYQKIYNIIISFSEAEKLRWKNLSFINMYPTILEAKNETILFNIHSDLESLLINDDEKKVKLILENFYENNKIEKEQSRDILFSVLSYCLQKINTGYTNYYAHIVDLFHIIENNGLILNVYNKMDLSTYKNFITCALKIKKINEAESFLEKYKNNLPEELQIEVYNFNKALIEFEKKEYSNVLKLILFCKFSDIFYKFNQRRLLIKTYFELSNSDETYLNTLLDSINAFKKHLNAQKQIPNNFITLNKNFLKFIDMLLSKQKMNKQEKTNLLEKLKNIEQITERNWLEEKIANFNEK